jgi:biotin carboxyl carrier protein
MKLVARHEGETHPITVERTGSGYRVRLRDEWFDAELVDANRVVRMLRLSDGRQFVFTHHSDGAKHDFSFGDRRVNLEVHDPLALRSRRAGDEGGASARIKAIMPGRVVRVLVAEGDEVKKGEGLLILEAMKMENQIVAPRDGRVAALLVAPGQTVENGVELILLEA